MCHLLLDKVVYRCPLHPVDWCSVEFLNQLFSYQLKFRNAAKHCRFTNLPGNHLIPGDFSTWALCFCDFLPSLWHLFILVLVVFVIEDDQALKTIRQQCPDMETIKGMTGYPFRCSVYLEGSLFYTWSDPTEVCTCVCLSVT